MARQVVILVAYLWLAYCQNNAWAELSLVEIAAKAKPAVVTVVTYDSKGNKTGQATGFFVKPDLVVTCQHAVNNCAKVKVKDLHGNMHLVSGVLNQNVVADVATLSLSRPAESCSALNLGETVPRDGERIVVMGGPLGLEYSVTEGIVSAVRVFPGLVTMLQISAPIARGSSGSPVMDMNGAVVAMVSGYVEGGQNLNFAVHASAISESLRVEPTTANLGLPSDEANNRKSKLRRAAEALFGGDATEAFAIKCDKALPFCLEALALDENDTTSNFLAGLCLYELGRHKEAADKLEKATRGPKPTGLAYYYLGMSYASLSRVQDAIVALEAAVKTNRTYAEAHLALGVLYSSENPEKAYDHLRECIRLAPDIPNSYYLIPGVCTRLNKDDEALKWANEGVKRSPTDPRAHCALGGVYTTLAWGVFLEASLSNGEVLERLKMAEAKARPHREKALGCYREAVRLDPNSIEALYGLGQVYSQLDREDEGIQCYKEVVRLNPKHAEAHYALGSYYALVGRDTPKALEEYRVLKELDPNRADALFKLIYP